MKKSKKIIGGLRKNGSKWYARFVSSAEFPSQKATTAVFVVPFYNDQILAVNIQEGDHKGWDIPGGHLNKNKDESIKEALHREVFEEAGVELSEYTPIGYIESDYDPEKITYMVIFWGQVTDLKPFKADFEAVERRLMTRKEFEKEYSGGNLDLLKVILEAAWSYHQKWKRK